jgi:5-methylcytosine-specific restriction endonuclease McrA
MDHLLQISDGRGHYKTYPHRFYLWSHGFSFDRKKQCWSKSIDADAAKKYIKFAESKHLKYEFASSRTKRNSNYKKKWMDANPSWHGLYLCTYCGWPVSEDKITVDHIVPIQAAKTSIKFEKSGKDINSLENLCGACSKCNRKKSYKQGLWVLKGQIFRHKSARIVRLFIRTVLIVLVTWWLARYLALNNGAEAIVKLAIEFKNTINDVLNGVIR